MALNVHKLQTIARVVSGYFDIEIATMFKKSRKREIVQIRQYFHYLAKVNTKAPAREIGSFSTSYGKTYDHATIFHSAKSITNLAETNKAEAEVLNALQNQVSIALKGLDKKRDIKDVKSALINAISNTTDEVELYDLLTQQLEYLEANPKEIIDYDTRSTTSEI